MLIVSQIPSYEELEKRISELEEILCAEIPSKTQEYLQKVLDCSQSVIYTKDLNGRYQFINNKFEDLSGFKKKDIISKTDFELFPESVAQNSTKNDRRVIETGTMLEIEELAPVEDRMHIFNTTKFPLINEDDGKIYEICGVSTNITDRKLTEQALKESHEVLEKKVNERTFDLKEMNTVLEVLLKKRDVDEKNIKEQILSNVSSLISPYIKKLAKTNMDYEQQTLLKIVEANVAEIISPITHKFASSSFGLTFTEIKVANLIKEGMKSKEIGKILNLSPRTIDKYREKIRTKLSIKNKKVNLQAYLASIQ